MSVHRNDAPDLVTLLRAHVAAQPEAHAIAFVADHNSGPSGVLRWSYAQLDQQARRYGAWLSDRLAPGSRVMLVHPTGPDFAGAFLGCLYAGMLAVPTPLPGTSRQGRLRLSRVLDDCGAGAVLTTASKKQNVLEWVAESGADDLLIGTEELPDASDWDPLPSNPSGVALLQYTSGSTGDPKGVIVTHDNLIFNNRESTRALGWTEGAGGGWLPLHHDMGLASQIVCPLVLGQCGVLMDPVAFIRRPADWLRMIDVHDLRLSFAPNFAFELCVRKVSPEVAAGLDLSRWAMAGCGAEPVDARVIEAFTERFAISGFRREALTPVYGLAEATVYVSGAPGRPPVVRDIDPGALADGVFAPAVPGRPARRAVGCGAPTGACEVAVVDPATRKVLPEGRLGEFWLRGRSISPGYWGRDDNAAVFAARTADGDGGFLRTGDLGTLCDGQLFVQGRIKDMLIVHGRNVYPEDVEQELRAQHAELGKFGVVFEGSDELEPGVVVTHEVTPIPAEHLPALAARIRHTVVREFGVSVSAVALLRPGTVPRTTSGKVRRRATRDIFHEGTLTPLYQDRG